MSEKDNKNLIGNIGDDADLDSFFDVLEDPNICEVKDIDISREGWEVIVYFDDIDPKNLSFEVGNDWWYLEQGEAIGLFKLKYEKLPVRRAILSYSEDCDDCSFDERHLDIFKKYRVFAKAPIEARKVEDLKVEVSARVDEVIDSQEDFEEVLCNDFDHQKVLNLNFLVLVVRLSRKESLNKNILYKIAKIAKAENLLLDIERKENELELCFTKKDEAQYGQMQEENAAFLQSFEYEILE